MTQLARRGRKKARVTAAVTIGEKRKVQRVAKARERDESTLLFLHGIQEILQIHDKLFPSKTTPT